MMKKINKLENYLQILCNDSGRWANIDKTDVHFQTGDIHMVKKINRAAFSRKKLREVFGEKPGLVQVGSKNTTVPVECREIVLWGYASGGKVRKGVYQFSIPIETLIEFDYKNKRFTEGDQKILFAASLFDRTRHAIALFDWTELVDKVLLPKNGFGSVINFCVSKKRRAKKFSIKTRDCKVFCLMQTDWLKVRRRRRLIMN